MLTSQATGYPQPRIWWEHAEHLSGSLTPTHYQPVISNSHIHALENGSLIIKEVVKKDEGLYLCQVGFHDDFSLMMEIPFCHFLAFNQRRKACTNEWREHVVSEQILMTLPFTPRRY